MTRASKKKNGGQAREMNKKTLSGFVPNGVKGFTVTVCFIVLVDSIPVGTL